MRGADAEPRQRERPHHRRSRPRRPRSFALGGALCALLCLSVSVRGTADVPLSQWCAEAGIGGADAKFAAEGFHTLAEVVEAELSAADLAEIGLDDAQAKLFFRAFAGGGGGEGEGGDSSLRSWLGELGIEEAYSNFEAEGFTTLAEVVEAELTDDDLKELGLRLKARKLVKIELEKLPEVEPAGAPAPGPTPARKPASKPAAPEKVTEMPKIQMDDIIMLPNGGQMVGKEAWGTIIQTAVRRPKVTSLEMLDEAVQEHSGFAAMAEESSILFAGPDGTEITDIEQAKLTGPPPRLYARPEEDHWVWPGVEVGHKELVQLPVNEFYSLDGPSSVSEDPEGWSAPAPVDLEAQAAARAEAEQQEAELAAQRKKAAKSKRARRKEKKRKEKASKAKAKELEEREGSDVGTAPFTVETLSLQPKVLRVRNFISRAEAAALRRMGEDAELEERLMQGPPGCEDSPAGCDVFRNETASWLAPSFGHWSVLPPYGAEPLLAGVRRRLSTLLRIDPALMEATTISRMQAGNHHWSHHDFHTAMVTQDPLDLGYFDDETINRFVSANIFLNDPSSNDFSSGGELNFPVAGSYDADMQKGCAGIEGVECGGAHSVESFAAARAADANGRAGDWVACDKGLRVQPEAGALVLHYNQPATGHLDGAVDFKAFNAVCDVQAEHGAVGAWRATQWFTNRMPERPLQHQLGAPGAYKGQGERVHAASPSRESDMKVDFADPAEEGASAGGGGGWFE